MSARAGAVTLLGIRPAEWRLVGCPLTKSVVRSRRVARYQSTNPKLIHTSPGAPKGYSYLTDSSSAPGEQQRPRLTRISWLRVSSSFFESDRVYPHPKPNPQMPLVYATVRNPTLRKYTVDPPAAGRARPGSTMVRN